ncbi:hypothetical protein F4677DRAFT_443988 [Hypoxylon crocopeplum]|nr:hypothetical protein F4677DRAFT_443988 [Hypoxylon crocopeplum]
MTAELGVANFYNTKSWRDQISSWTLAPNTGLFILQSSIIDGIAGAIFQPNFECPADNCIWDDFTTLGACSSYQNVTDTVTVNCEHGYEDKILYNCSYVFPDELVAGKNMTFGDINSDPYLRAEWFRTWFTSSANAPIGNGSIENIYPSSPRISGDVDIANFLSTTDFANFTSNLATTLTNQIRSANPGDNRNETLLYGKALVNEIYIHARWLWAAFPSTITILTEILLVISIAITRDEPLYKGSALALLFHGLGDWPDINVQELETAEELESTAKHMSTRLMEDREGGLKFMKV